MPTSRQADASGATRQRPRHSGGWWGLALLLAAVIAWGSLMPASELPEDLPWDKANHLLAYAGLAALVALACDRVWLSVGLAVGYGVLIELAQIPVPGRLGGDPWDMLANTLGALLGVLLVCQCRRLWRRRLWRGR
ncbi:VanZ family protein [Halomonas sp. DP8Y7-1]|uniref:VanZ family protein n=1 Tax=Halomonas sp. DP8Y7-1 TaxID=2859078 RepID=UPI001C95FB98|nr:VanZ family protein [Halomonas sp. DP8Y7-1]MBY6031307.1 VanZ family protein [Halomonas sp. DP8Y7-1]